MTDLDAVKQRQQQAWASGDYAVVGSTLQIIAEELCEFVDVRSRERVLDVATGSGNAALAAARRQSSVVGIDYVPTLLDHGRRRARAEGLTVEFTHGDAEAIPFEDASFDVVLSVLGTMFTPDQQRAAQELLRVCRSHGQIGLASWTPDGFIGSYFKVTATYMPPSPDVESPFRWGDEHGIEALLGSGVVDLKTERRQFMFRHPSAHDFVAWMRRWYGPTHTAFSKLDHAGRAALEADLVALAEEHNLADDGTLVAPAAYLQVRATAAS